jgi:cell surface protein SprA
MKDSRHAFENGLPADGDTTRTTNNTWGRVTQEQYLTNAFDNSEIARPNQDVGMDGVINSDEPNYFGDFVSDLNVNGEALDRILEDVSADNFQYFLGAELDADDAKILERYKEFNLTDGNSPLVVGTTEYTPVGTTFPDNEDLNFDNTLSDLEEYYEYEVDLRPGSLEVGKNFVTEVITNEINGQRVNWYLIRIPILKPNRIQGNIVGFKSIRFIRSIMTDWQQPAVLRMVKFQLVGAQWRRYPLSLRDRYLMEPPEIVNSNFVFSVVNLEENGSPAAGETPYVLPPGIKQDIDNTSPIYRQTNEQSIKLTVDGLVDGDARGVFKNVALNLVNYGRIKMFFHAQNNGNQGDSATAFLRLGTDMIDNYYEVEVPLVFTPRGSTDPNVIWPEENNIDMEFADLYALKKLRDKGDLNINIPFSQNVRQYKITVVGRPDLHDVQAMMIGVRNPKSPDGDPISIHIWANELRVTDFKNDPGWAANARLDLKLADFATVNGDLRYSSVGFGSVSQRISERRREEVLDYDISANIALDKFIPEKVGLRIPMFISYEERKITPSYDPLDPDVPLEATLRTFDDPEERKAYSNLVQDVTTRKSINFTNVRKVKTKENAKSRIYDIENFSFTYASSSAIQRNVYKQDYINKNMRIGLAYNWSSTPITYEPFKNSKAFSSPWLQLIKDLNIAPLVSNLGFRWDLNRRFIREQLRNSDLTTEGILPTWEKSFFFDRNYNFRWNLTKSISVDYMARVNAIVDEPAGDIDTEAKRDSIITNLKNFGRMKTFDQDIGLTYRIPIDKTPLTDWINSDFRYRVGYTWKAGATDQADTLGNTVQNQRDWGLTGKFDLVKLKDINSPPRSSRRPAASRPSETDTLVQKRDNKFGKGFLRFLMMVRSVNFTYSNREGTVLPGYTPSVFLFGMDSSWSAPGWDFVFGSQSREIQNRAVENDWLARSEFLSFPFTQYNNIDLKLTANIEPAPDLRIQLVANKISTDNFHEIFRYNTDTLDDGTIGKVPVQLAPTRTGNYSITMVTIGTSFVKDDVDNNLILIPRMY